ncbi:MAG: hypothetical protein ACP5OX_00780 [Minisyncoccia bacterium]
MSKKYINQAPFWLFALNKGLKSSLVIFLLIFSFVGQWPGVLVEGSPTVVVGEDLFKTSSNIAKEANPLLATFVAINNPINPPKKIEVIVTGYSSTPEETDDTPFITASGKVVEEGVVAANFLEFGTKVRFPELFGDKIFIVEDRMHQRFNEGRVDIWFKTKQEAKDFGIQTTIMEIIEEPVYIIGTNSENKS